MQTIPMRNNYRNELECYLGAKMNRKQRKVLGAIEAYQELCVKYPEYEIPFEATAIQEPGLFIKLYNSAKYAIPNYWRNRTLKKLYQPGYSVPYLFTEFNLLDVRDALYEPEEKKRYRVASAALYLNPKILYDYCRTFKVNYVTDTFYDGTDSYFLRSCKPGILSNELREALGDENEKLLRAIENRRTEE